MCKSRLNDSAPVVMIEKNLNSYDIDLGFLTNDAPALRIRKSTIKVFNVFSSVK